MASNGAIFFGERKIIFDVRLYVFISVICINENKIKIDFLINELLCSLIGGGFDWFDEVYQIEIHHVLSKQWKNVLAIF